MTAADSQALRDKSARIRKYVRWYVLGSVCIVLFALLFIWLGVMMFLGWDLPRPLIILALGGIWLLWDIAKSWNYKTSLPKGFVKVSSSELPALFSLVNSVTSDLNIRQLSYIYLCPEPFAAVFIKPSLKNVFSKHPKLELVIGLGFLTQLSDKELKTILYHEFGHYCQESIRETGSVYRIGQFSKMFLADRKEFDSSTLSNQMKAQIALFASYTIVFVNHIQREYKGLSELMEFEADDIAASHQGGLLVKSAIQKASALKKAYEVIHWGLGFLPEGGHVENLYASLSTIAGSEGFLQELNEECRKRVARQPDSVMDTSPDTASVQSEIAPYISRVMPPTDGQAYPAAAFAAWLSDGLPIYQQEAEVRKSVTLFICLEKNKHKLPLAESIYEILLDGRTIGAGNYRAGYNLRYRTAPGTHTLSFYSPAGIKAIPFDFTAKSGIIYRLNIDYELEKKNGIYDIFVTDIEEISAVN